MARLGGSWGPLKQNSVRTTIRTYPAGSRVSLTEIRDKRGPSQPFRATGHYGSTVSLQSLTTECSASSTGNLKKSLEYAGGSLINLHDQTEVAHMKRRSPSLPPIYNKDSHQYSCQELRDFDVEGSRYQQRNSEKQQERRYLSNEGSDERRKEHYGSPAEERGGETSGYASDSIDAPVPAGQTGLLPECRPVVGEMTEKTWQNPYYTTPESSLPPSRRRRLSAGRIGELNRPRWGGVWGQETARGDPPPPSWLARLGHSSQVLVINHDSASSPDSSTTGSTGSDSNKTYLRGQNIHVDADILLEREAKRQKAMELQNAIKRQLEEKDRRRKEEKERQMREERLEEERIRRDRDKEKERFEEEQKRLKEKEDAKFRQAEAMKEVLETAERLAKEDKKNRRKVRDSSEELPARQMNERLESSHTSIGVNERFDETRSVTTSQENAQANCRRSETENLKDTKETSNQRQLENDKGKLSSTPRVEGTPKDCSSVQVPICKDVAIVLSGRLEDPEILAKANLQLVKLVVTPSPRKCEHSHGIMLGLNALIRNEPTTAATDSALFSCHSARTSPRIVENRLLTPSKYRMPSGTGRDFGTQTDIETDLQDIEEKAQESTGKEDPTKDRKETANVNRRDEKGNHTDELSLKPLPRSKSQPRTSLDSRPRWNANRPGTRYRTQSEKDPHYQRRLRLRRRQVESSDDGSRSPSPSRRKVNVQKLKGRNSTRRQVKLDSYDADLSMDSLNSVIPLRVDKNGRITLEDNKSLRKERGAEIERVKKSEGNSDIWCGQEILSKLSSLRNIMDFQLDDLLKDDKKDANSIPDLSKSTCDSQEQFRRLLEHCPEFKIKTEKVRKEDVKVRDKEFSWRATKKELRAADREWIYGDPVPPDMRSLNLRELQQVAIDWRMLTPIRPKQRQDEEMFSRLVYLRLTHLQSVVEMGKLEAKTVIRERRSSLLPSPIRRSKNRAGIIESSVKICGECAEEFCFGESCGDILYDSFIRVTITTHQPKVKVSADTEAIIANMNRKKKGKRKKKGLKAKVKGKSGRGGGESGGGGGKKSVRLLVRSKARKSITSENEIKLGKERDNEEENGKPVKLFKRKCSKYSKKYRK